MYTKNMSKNNVVILDRCNNTTCAINLHGATIVSWRIEKEEQLFVSSLASFDGKKPIQGGISIVFPKYGSWLFGTRHGFARITRWSLVKPVERLQNGDVKASFSLKDNEFTRSMWNYSFRIIYHVILKEKGLDFYVEISNPSKDLLISFDLLITTHLLVPDVRQCQISGLQWCTFIDTTRDSETYQDGRELVTIEESTDRIYENTQREHIITNTSSISSRKMKLEKCNFPDTFLWNPWIEEARKLIDFRDDEYTNMLCVGGGHVSKPITLLPGKSFGANQILRIVECENF